jgi:hypothetical protein
MVSLDRYKTYQSTMYMVYVTSDLFFFFFKTLNGLLQLFVNLETNQRNVQKKKTIMRGENIPDSLIDTETDKQKYRSTKHL